MQLLQEPVACLLNKNVQDPTENGIQSFIFFAFGKIVENVLSEGVRKGMARQEESIGFAGDYHRGCPFVLDENMVAFLVMAVDFGAVEKMADDTGYIAEPQAFDPSLEKRNGIFVFGLHIGADTLQAAVHKTESHNVVS